MSRPGIVAVRQRPAIHRAHGRSVERIADDVADLEAEPTIERERPLERSLEIARDAVAISSCQSRGEEGRAETATLEGRVDRDEDEVPMGLLRMPGGGRRESPIGGSESSRVEEADDRPIDGPPHVEGWRRRSESNQAATPTSRLSTTLASTCPTARASRTATRK
jgi:hypothetical protein